MELGERDKENKDSFFDEEDNQKSRSQSEIVLIPPIAVIEDSTANQEGNPDSHSEHVEPQEQFHEKSQEPPVPLKRSTREKKSAIFDDFVVFIHEHEDGIWMMDDPLSVCQAIKSVDSDEWTDAMNE